MRATALLIALTLVGSSFVHADSDSQARGQYLTGLLGCEGCHTEGRLLGKPGGAPFAGSTVGMAYGEYVDAVNPPLVFAGNLTPDHETGLGGWTRHEVIAAIKYGVNAHGEELVSAMPWLNYRQLTAEDAGSIADYLMGLEPVRNPVPDPVPVGKASEFSFIRLGMYIFVPQE